MLAQRASDGTAKWHDGTTLLRITHRLSYSDQTCSFSCNVKQSGSYIATQTRHPASDSGNGLDVVALP